MNLHSSISRFHYSRNCALGSTTRVFWTAGLVYNVVENADSNDYPETMCAKAVYLYYIIILLVIHLIFNSNYSKQYFNTFSKFFSDIKIH